MFFILNLPKMEEINLDELISYEESKEIKETIWKIWDLLNDKDIA